MNKMCYKFSSKSSERMKGVNSQLVSVFLQAIKLSPIDFGVPRYGGLRTPGEQNQLFQKNLSKCDGITNASNHQSGDALDFYAYIDGHASWDKVHLAIVGGCILSTAAAMKKKGEIDIELTWGASFGSDDFHGWDACHIEVFNV